MAFQEQVALMRRGNTHKETRMSLKQSEAESLRIKTQSANHNLSKMLMAKKEEIRRIQEASDTIDGAVDEPYEPDFNSRRTI